jgi:hypothetical protein
VSHTPGPWVVEMVDTPLSLARAAYVKGMGEELCILRAGGVNDVEADARLRAAAPDLLHALSELAACAEKYMQYHAAKFYEGKQFHERDGLNPFIERARAAIKKAKGES